jgi:hypothetical protein
MRNGVTITSKAASTKITVTSAKPRCLTPDECLISLIYCTVPYTPGPRVLTQEVIEVYDGLLDAGVMKIYFAATEEE